VAHVQDGFIETLANPQQQHLSSQLAVLNDRIFLVLATLLGGIARACDVMARYDLAPICTVGVVTDCPHLGATSVSSATWRAKINHRRETARILITE
jgi:hypothetical protein